MRGKSASITAMELTDMDVAAWVMAPGAPRRCRCATVEHRAAAARASSPVQDSRNRTCHPSVAAALSFLIKQAQGSRSPENCEMSRVEICARIAEVNSKRCARFAKRSLGKPATPSKVLAHGADAGAGAGTGTGTGMGGICWRRGLWLRTCSRATWAMAKHSPRWQQRRLRPREQRGGGIGMSGH